jgi:hypothetical protein
MVIPSAVGDVKVAAEINMLTQGFLNDRQLDRHFVMHGADFELSSASAYQSLADEFLGGPRPATVHECTRKKGDIVRFDAHTGAFGVLDRRRVIRTFFKPVPCSSLPLSIRIAAQQSGRCHSYANNLLYFQSECERW